MLDLVLMRRLLSAVAIGFMLSMEAAGASVGRPERGGSIREVQRADDVGGQPPQGRVESITLPAPGAVARKLAAILSACVVGYSRLMAEDEAGTIRTLADCREEIATFVRQQQGRVVDIVG